MKLKGILKDATMQCQFLLWPLKTVENATKTGRTMDRCTITGKSPAVNAYNVKKNIVIKGYECIINNEKMHQKQTAMHE